MFEGGCHEWQTSMPMLAALKAGTLCFQNKTCLVSKWQLVDDILKPKEC